VEASPYRLAAPHDPGFAPAVGWTRIVANVLGVGSLVIPAFVVRDLIADENCQHEPTPHLEIAFVVVVVAALVTWLSLLLQRRLARWVHERRVRSSIVGAICAAATLLPNVLAGIGLGFFGVSISFAYTWDLCLNAMPFGH
jgi:hypothetical protein